jgi:hypothetical protein
LRWFWVANLRENHETNPLGLPKVGVWGVGLSKKYWTALDLFKEA